MKKSPARGCLVALALLVLFVVAVIVASATGVFVTSAVQRTGIATIVGCDKAWFHHSCDATVRWDDGATEQGVTVRSKGQITGDHRVSLHREIGGSSALSKNVVVAENYPTRGTPALVLSIIGLPVAALVAVGVAGSVLSRRRHTKG